MGDSLYISLANITKDQGRLRAKKEKEKRRKILYVNIAQMYTITAQ